MPSVRRTGSVRRSKRIKPPVEHRVVTPRPDLFVLRLGKSKSIVGAREAEKSGTLIDGIIKATLKPGVPRDIVFRNNLVKSVYAYSVYPNDVTKIVREDAHGNKTIGRLVGGKFRPLRSNAV